jgi:zinc transport system ATP-binding protein
MMNREIIRLENVSFSYSGYMVLENINLSIFERDLIAVIGPNGGGKTTMIKLMLGLLKPSTGSLKLFGDSPEKKRNSVGYLPQTNSIDITFPLSVYEAVLMGIYNGAGKRYTRDDHLSVESALETTGIKNLQNRHISMLSGGQTQRMLIARALVKNPEVLLLDEPMSGVDPEMQAAFYDLILHLNKKMAIVFVTHDISVISAYFEKVICLNHKLYYHGPKEGSLGKLEDTYGCPVELLAHGIPHRVLKEH